METYYFSSKKNAENIKSNVTRNKQNSLINTVLNCTISDKKDWHSLKMKSRIRTY